MLPEKLDIAEKRKSAPWVVSKSTLHIVFSTTVEHLHSAKKKSRANFQMVFPSVIHAAHPMQQGVTLHAGNMFAQILTGYL